MNPAFIILVIIAAVILWFALSKTFFFTGNFLDKIWKNTINEINKNDDKGEKNNGRKQE